MSHVYQPVMLRRLLIGSGTAKVEEIALDLVQNDLSQIDSRTYRRGVPGLTGAAKLGAAFTFSFRL